MLGQFLTSSGVHLFALFVIRIGLCPCGLFLALELCLNVPWFVLMGLCGANGYQVYLQSLI
jgi:hypothetical protein